MPVTKIHVHTQCDKSTLGFARFMWETMMKLANHPDELRITAHCMGPAATERLTGLLKNGQSKLVPNTGKEGMNGSYGHGACVMDALAMTGDGSIHIIADSDTVMVAKGWDDYVRTRLEVDGIGIMGTTYEDLGGFSSGKGNTQTYKKVPTVTWCALSPKHDWRDLNVLPDKSKIVSITNQELSLTYNLPIGYSIFGEVAYQIPQYVRDCQLTYDGWKQLKPTKDAIVLHGLSDYHEEYHTSDTGTPFVVHHRGSMKHAYRGDKISTAFFNAVDRHLLSEVDKTPKWSTPQCDCIANPPSKIEKVIEPEPIIVDRDEWMKVSFNGEPVRKKSKIDRHAPRTSISFLRPKPDTIAHLRLEGNLAAPFAITIPKTPDSPYVLSCRNVSGNTVFVSSDDGPNIVRIPDNKVFWLLVDVDGVCHIE